MFAHIKGPLSCTTSYAVAANFASAGDDGMILTLEWSKNWIIKESRVRQGFKEAGEWRIDKERPRRFVGFDCQWISCYPNEQELFSIGGLYPMVFDTIIELKVGIDYQKYINGIKQLSRNMSTGGDTFTDYEAKSNFEKQMAFRLLAHQLWRNKVNHKYALEYKSCPDYIRNILNEHCKRIKTIIFPENETSQPFMLLFKLDNGWINIDDLVTVFPQLEKIHFNAIFKDTSFWRSKFIYNSILSRLEFDNGSNLKLIAIWGDVQHIGGRVVTVGGWGQFAYETFDMRQEEFAKYGWKSSIEMFGIYSIGDKTIPRMIMVICKSGHEEKFTPDFRYVKELHPI